MNTPYRYCLETRTITVPVARRKHSNRWSFVGGIETLPASVVARLRKRGLVEDIRYCPPRASMPTRPFIGFSVRTGRPVMGCEGWVYGTAHLYYCPSSL